MCSLFELKNLKVGIERRTSPGITGQHEHRESICSVDGAHFQGLSFWEPQFKVSLAWPQVTSLSIASLFFRIS